MRRVDDVRACARVCRFLFHLAMHLTQHTDLSMDIDSLFDTIRLCSEELFTIGLKLSKFMQSFFSILLS